MCGSTSVYSRKRFLCVPRSRFHFGSYATSPFSDLGKFYIDVCGEGKTYAAAA